MSTRAGPAAGTAAATPTEGLALSVPPGDDQEGAPRSPRHLARATRGRARGEGSSGSPLLRTWLLSFVVIWLASAAWSLASPMGSAPDEPAHLIRAASLVRGQLLGTPVRDGSPASKSSVVVKVPQVFARLANDVQCFQFKPAVPASCQGSLAGSRKDVAIYTYVGRYPPLYYALVGLPTLVAVSPTGMYLARLVSAALSAGMLALAVVSLRRCRGMPLLGAGLALAVTPMAFYLGGVINPSGLEISSAISAWAAGMALVSRRGEKAPPPAMVAALGISLIVLMLVRGITPLWALLIGLALAALFGHDMRSLARVRSVQGWSAGCVAAGLAALAWDLYANPFLTEPGSPVPKGASTSQVFMLALERLDLLVTSSIGQFGWLDTPSPFGVIVTWLGALGAVFLVGLCFARRRDALVAVATLAAWVVVSFALIFSQARSEGILGQGRDFMALGVGIPIVAASVAGERFGARAGALRLGTAVIAALFVCQVLDFYGALRRNTVGMAGPVNAFASTHNAWHPALPALLLWIVFAIAVGLFALLVRWAAQLQPEALPGR